MENILEMLNYFDKKMLNKHTIFYLYSILKIIKKLLTNLKNVKIKFLFLFYFL